MAFKAEELMTQILPAGDGLWACPESTITKGKPCGGNTKPPCSQGTLAPGGGGGCPQDTRKPPKKAEGLDRNALVLLQGQLRDRLIAAGL